MFIGAVLSTDSQRSARQRCRRGGSRLTSADGAVNTSKFFLSFRKGSFNITTDCERSLLSLPSARETMRPTRPPPNKMPGAVSKYIVEYYVRNSDVLLTNTSLRTMEANTLRALAIKKLIAELQEQFGYSTTERKIRNHFDHVRSKCLSKGGGLGLPSAERNRFVHRDAERNSFGELRKRVFLNSGEQALLRYYKSQEADNAREQGTSQHNQMFMRERESFNRMHTREDDHQHSASEEVEVKEESRPADLSDDCVIEELTGFDEEESNDNGRIDVDSPTCPFSHACESSSEAMNELRLLCMALRKPSYKPRTTGDVDSQHVISLFFYNSTAATFLARHYDRIMFEKAMVLRCSCMLFYADGLSYAPLETQMS
ncbi:unnamed protein product [Cylicocyclus nassatus]|uniref:Uncharacterized protein n=1 Tax=Cylicocyclus nassatus TaxID=53992 RepID=A0AA36H5T9_CYLNA|nr:unnamed protein product [Cylicocyclus nassatus]